jgi:hypothetical protein
MLLVADGLSLKGASNNRGVRTVQGCTAIFDHGK